MTIGTCFADLVVVGFDPLADEIERLSKADSFRRRRYFARMVGQQGVAPVDLPPDASTFARTSAARAAQLLDFDSRRANFDRTGSGRMTSEAVELDVFFHEHPMDIDFLKTDTDGSDLQVLRGAAKLLSDTPILGVGVECFFCGPADDGSSTFRNIDRFLAASGFTLFDLEIHRYSRSALPSPFVYRIPAQTLQGQVRCADALYLRDAGNVRNRRDKGVSLEPVKLIKLACVFEIFGLEDCAAELLLEHRNALSAHLDVNRCLDLLTPTRNGRRLSYAQYMQVFEKDPATFYPPA